ncbi:hypothetical protein J8I87_30565 [Paraburkholderia sp. LEh10]|uniref:hypothetical protein n=1 Tax=Paraburkholderia sp. LEh10 TaxID=2821353 RepID=UPI001AE87377|nr:hypothetical protein [Paraburkholderia sp. LEh10]MBP0593945.1 hypothetical protein [Paraburkholderia sp. LEh10]
MSQSLNAIGASASRVMPGHAVPQPTSPTDWLAIGRALLAQTRREYGIPDSAHTVAVGWTGIDGLSARRFVGASPTIRATTRIPDPTDHINAPRENAAFRDHAEQDVANAFIDAMDSLPHKPHTDGEWLRIIVSQRPCSPCVQGLNERLVAPGVLGQLSRLYPGLTVVVAWEEAHRLQHLLIQNGIRL